MVKDLLVKISASIAGLKKGLSEAVTVTQTASKKIDQSAKQVGDSLNQAFSGQYRQNIEQLNEAISTQRTRINGLKTALQAAQKAQQKYKQGSPQWEASEKAIQAYKKAIRSATVELDKLNISARDNKTALAASRLAAEDNSSAMEALSRTTTALTGAILLLGDEVEGLQPLMKGLRIAVGGLNAVVAIQNLRLRENAQFTKALSSAQNLYKRATTGATTATTIFKRTLGVGLLIAFAYRLLTISSAFKTIKTPAQQAESAIAGFTGALKRNFDLYDRSVKTIQDLAEIEELRAQVAGKSELEIRNIKIKSINDQLDALDKLEKRNQESRKQALTDIKAAPGVASTLTYQKTIEAQNKIDTQRAELLKQLEIVKLNFQLGVNKKIQKENEKLTDAKIVDARRLEREALKISENEALARIESQKGILLDAAKTEEERQKIIFDAKNQELNIREFFANEEFRLNSESIDAANNLNIEISKINKQRQDLENQKNDALKKARDKDFENLIQSQEMMSQAMAESFEGTLKLYDNFYDQEEAVVKQRYADGITNESEYLDQLNQLTLERLEARLAIYKAFGMNVGEIEKQIADLRIKSNKDTNKSIEDEAKRFTRVIQNSFNNLANSLANALSEGISVAISGKGGLNDIFNGMLSAIGSFLQQLGTGLVAAGLATEAFQKLLAVNPAAAIPFGLAAIVAGAAVKATISDGVAFADGGIVSGPTLGLVGEYPGASTNPEVIAPLNKLKGMLDMNGGNEGYIAETRISGRDLAIVLNRYNNDAKRI